MVAVLKVLLMLLSSTQAFNLTSKCCAENFYLSSSKCVGPDEHADNIKLTCSTGMYILDPNEEPDDTFTEIEGGRLRLDQFDSPIEAGTWCAVQKENDSLAVALVCFTEAGGRDSKFVEHFYGALMLVSCAFLFTTFVIYVLIPELRDLQGKCLMANILSLAFGFLPLAFIQFYGSTISEELCVTKAFFLYFWLLSSFFWLNVVSFNVWCSVILPGKLNVREDYLFLMFCSYAWGIPFLFLVASIITHFAPAHLKLLRPYFGHSRCWFHGPEETWAYFYGPIAFLLSINIYLFASSALKLWRNERGTSTRLRSHRFKCLLYLKLFIVMGLTWMFEVISYAYGEMNFFWYITDALNCLQGVLIFVILICRKRTLRAIASRNWGSFLCPRYTMFGGIDEEESEEMMQEDVELSRPAA